MNVVEGVDFFKRNFWSVPSSNKTYGRDDNIACNNNYESHLHAKKLEPST